jgi:acyl-CoA oxidase
LALEDRARDERDVFAAIVEAVQLDAQLEARCQVTLERFFAAVGRADQSEVGGLGAVIAQAVIFAAIHEPEQVSLQVFRQVAALKAVASSEVALELYRLRERCGAVGMLSANRIIDYLNQVQGLVTAEGDNQLMLLKVGRQLWDAGVPSAPPEPPRLDDVGSATAQQLLSLFRFRESRVAHELRASVFEMRGRTRAAFSIWNENVNATMSAASSHGLCLIAESFCNAIEEARDGTVSVALTALFRLWCAEQLERSAGWFLAHGCLDTATVLDLSRKRDEQCAIIEASGGPLADAFGFDNSILQAPIAEEDYTERYDSFFRDAEVGCR